MPRPTGKRRDHVDRVASEQAARTHDNVVRTRPDHPGMDATLADVLDTGWRAIG